MAGEPPVPGERWCAQAAPFFREGHASQACRGDRARAREAACLQPAENDCGVDGIRQTKG